MTSGACMPQEAMKKGYIKIWYDGVVTTLNLQHVAEQFRRMDYAIWHAYASPLFLSSSFLHPLLFSSLYLKTLPISGLTSHSMPHKSSQILTNFINFSHNAL